MGMRRIRLKELKADLKTFFKIVLVLLVIMGSIQLYKYSSNSSYYESAFGLHDNEDFEELPFTDTFSTEKGHSLKNEDDSNNPTGVELSIKDSYKYKEVSDSYSVTMQNSIILENTGDVPIFIEEINSKFKSPDGDLEDGIDMEDFDLLFDRVPERPIYPGEEFNYNQDPYLDESESLELEEDLNIDNLSDVEVIYEVDYYAQEKDVEAVQEGKKIKENPYEVTYNQKNIVVDEEDEETVVTGELSLLTDFRDLEGTYDFPVSLKFYDENGDLHYIEKQYLSVIDEKVDLEDVEFEPIPAPLIFDTSVEDLYLKVHVLNG